MAFDRDDCVSLLSCKLDAIFNKLDAYREDEYAFVGIAVKPRESRVVLILRPNEKFYLVPNMLCDVCRAMTAFSSPVCRGPDFFACRDCSLDMLDEAQPTVGHAR